MMGFSTRAQLLFAGVRRAARARWRANFVADLRARWTEWEVS